MLPDPTAQHSRKVFRRKKNIAAVDVNQQHWVEESGQWLENADKTHLVLASGKPVSQICKKSLTEPA